MSDDTLPEPERLPLTPDELKKRNLEPFAPFYQAPPADSYADPTTPYDLRPGPSPFSLRRRSSASPSALRGPAGARQAIGSRSRHLSSTGRRIARMRYTPRSPSPMSDIGLGPWFNGKPQHSDLDSTNRISQEQYALLDRAMHGRPLDPSGPKDDPYDLGIAWVTGAGPRSRDYYDGDEMTELIKASVSMEQLRADTLSQWNADGKGEGRVSYSISDGGKMGALKKLIGTDIPAIATGDPDHLGEAFMGSYSLGYEVKGQDPDGSVVVQYTLDNHTSNESFLHFVGYYDWLKKTNREEGPFSTVSQTITWTERSPAGTK